MILQQKLIIELTRTIESFCQGILAGMFLVQVLRLIGEMPPQQLGGTIFSMKNYL